MKLAQSTKNYFAMLGISSDQSLANVTFFMVELIFVVHDCFSWGYLIYEANTFREYTYGLFYITTMAMVAACFTIYAIKKIHLFKMFDLGEELIEKSE